MTSTELSPSSDLSAIQRILANTEAHAARSDTMNTVDAGSRVDRETRERQHNVGRILLQSRTPLVVDSADDDDDDDDDDNNNTKAAAAPPLTWNDRCCNAIGCTLAALCVEISNEKDRDEAQRHPNAVVAEAKSRIMRAEALAEHEQARPDVEPLDVSFKRWLNVRSGDAQKQIEARLRAEQPRADALKIRQMAEAELSAMVSDKTSRWAQFFADDKMALLLRRYQDMGDDNARRILDAYMDYKTRLESETPQQLQQRQHDLRLQRIERETARADQRAERREIHALIGLEPGAQPVPHDHPRYAPTDPVQGALTEPVRRVNRPGAVVQQVPVNGAGDVLGPRQRTAAEYLYAFQHSQSDSDEQVHRRVAERIAMSVKRAINLHLKFMDVADPAVLFASVAEGSTPSGNTVQDLLALLRHSGVETGGDGVVVRYLAEWQRCLSESRVDIDNAVAARHRDYDADTVARLMGEHSMTRTQVEANMVFGIDPASCEIMRRLLWAVDHEWFKQTDSEAAERYQHAERAERLKRRAKRRRTSDNQSGSGGAADSSASSSSEAAAAAAAGTGSGGGGTGGARTLDELEESHEEEVARAAVESNNSFTLEANLRDEILQSHVARRMPVLSADYLADFMRRGLGEQVGERDCLNGNDCYCASIATIYPYASEIKTHGRNFVCRELLLPDELDMWRVEGRLPARRNFCVFCEMALVTLRHARHVQERVTPSSVLHRWSVSTGPGQFNPECMLPVAHDDRWTGVVRAFPRLNRNNFVPGETRLGPTSVPCLRMTDQLDFRLTSRKRTYI